MKKILLLTLIMLSLGIFAQTEKQIAPKKHEIKANMLMFIALESADITYENILSNETSMGISASYWFGNHDFKYMLTPFYRLYFGYHRAGGFFIEINSSLYSLETESSDYNYATGTYDNLRIENKTGFGFGLAIGGKFINSDKWIGEVFAGLGRNIIHHEGSFINIYPRFGVSLGHRF